MSKKRGPRPENSGRLEPPTDRLKGALRIPFELRAGRGRGLGGLGPGRGARERAVGDGGGLQGIASIPTHPPTGRHVTALITPPWCVRMEPGCVRRGEEPHPPFISKPLLINGCRKNNLKISHAPSAPFILFCSQLRHVQAHQSPSSQHPLPTPQPNPTHPVARAGRRSSISIQLFVI